MADESEQDAVMHERFSALMDGELQRDGVSGACASWHGEAQVRARWHTYHLIGDVMRSDDLACDPAHDAAFLSAIRVRLSSEPIVLAPEPVEPVAMPHVAATRFASDRRRRWVASGAMAAGVAAVAGVLVLLRSPGAWPDRAAVAMVAQGTPPSTTSVVASTPVAAVAPVTDPAVAVPVAEDRIFVANGQLIRDARLDRYLAAHKQFAGTSALGVPSGYLRNATADAADR